MTDQTTTIPKGWKMTTLGEVADVKGGKRLPPKMTLVTYKTKHPYIRITDLENNKIKKDQLQFITDDVFSSISRYIVNSGDVILSIVGSIGFVARIDDDLNNANLTENCVKFVNLKNLDSKFLYYFLVSKVGQNEITKNTVGAVQKKLPIYGVQNINIQLPPLPEQRAIAAVLSSLDDKIELLREQNKTLEATAQAIFKEWFVRFNFPNENGEPYATAGGKMIDSILGLIPEGWRVGRLGDIVELFDAKRIPLASDVRAKRKGKYPYYGATSIMDFIDDYLFDGTFLLLAEDGSVIDDRGRPVLQYVWGQFWVSNHAHVLQGKNGFSTEMLHVVLKDANITGIVNGAVQLKINQANLLSFEILIPDKHTLNNFDLLLKPIYQKIKNISSQIQTLSTLRDTLLPKLMKGEIRVKSEE
jgi:type I restriction enzyme S subunit